MSFITSKIALGIDDRTRHWSYHTSTPRKAAEKAVSIHQDDVGGGTVQTVCQVHNGRGRNDLKLDDASFELVNNFSTKLSTEDFYKLQAGDGDLAIQYNEEVEAFVAQKIGCDKVLCVQSQVRNSTMDGSDGVQGYAGGGPHTDSSSVSADVFALNVLKANCLDDGTGCKYKRYCYLNLWRNISGEHPIRDNHLALLDERTVVKPDDYLPRDIIGDGYEVTQYHLSARHARQHKWYYFPHMIGDEAILFKQMDSDWTKSGRVCFHMSVSDPTVTSNDETAVPPRESVEIRMLCFWKDATVDSMPTSENVHRDMIQSPRQHAIRLKGSSSNSSLALQSASLLQLFFAMFCKLPLVGGLFGRILDSFGYSTKERGKVEGPKMYSGNASDYVDQFFQTLETYPSWHGSSKSWAKVQMNRHKTPNGGIQGITKTLVEDQLGYQETKNFSQQAKAEIVAVLLESDNFMEVCKKHLEPLLD